MGLRGSVKKKHFTVKNRPAHSSGADADTGRRILGRWRSVDGVLTGACALC